MEQHGKRKLKILLLWLGFFFGMLILAVLYRHGGNINGKDHPILIAALLPLFTGFAVVFYVVLWELFVEFKWKLLVILLLIPFPALFYLTVYAVFLVKLVRDSIYVFRFNK
ncbi:hypothetical protein BGP77_13410 [Saccharospirillum sp. MSK14-1]|uniref:hypothetical protein n=1 Tax=Saccharospirillum sp. MSK14-1 TaxID=1897632 RepID=UPI000D3C3105|nr:hypothetical protein [Saccharospirillum sp. MSK14-1]PTY37494.1 hypothetical protein BGP77_13410 [Saccharospirillum sp. MSK14-1]